MPRARTDQRLSLARAASLEYVVPCGTLTVRESVREYFQKGHKGCCSLPDSGLNV